MKRIVPLVWLLLCSLSLPAAAADPAPFQLIYRQQNVMCDRFTTRSDLLITVVNLSGGEAKDVVVSIPVSNPFFYVDSPIVVGTVPQGHQTEILKQSDLPNDVIELTELDENLVWRIEYSLDAGERVAVVVKGVEAK